jgi:hypothetical protein
VRSSPVDQDQRLIAAVDKARDALITHAAAATKARATFALVEADPERLGYAALREAHTGLEESAINRLYTETHDRLSERHGYGVAKAAWDAAGDVLEHLLDQVFPLRPTTLRGAALKAALLLDTVRDDEGESLLTDDTREAVLSALAADMRRLAGEPTSAGRVAR